MLWKPLIRHSIHGGPTLESTHNRPIAHLIVSSTVYRRDVQPSCSATTCHKTAQVTYSAVQDNHWVVPWLRRLVTALSSRRSGSVRVGFVLDKVALRQVFLRVYRFLSVSIIPPWLNTHISSGGWTVCPLVSTADRTAMNTMSKVITEQLTGTEFFMKFPIMEPEDSRLQKHPLNPILRSLHSGLL
jgi:hypothetical protein